MDSSATDVRETLTVDERSSLGVGSVALLSILFTLSPEPYMVPETTEDSNVRIVTSGTPGTADPLELTDVLTEVQLLEQLRAIHTDLSAHSKPLSAEAQAYLNESAWDLYET